MHVVCSGGVHVRLYPELPTTDIGNPANAHRTRSGLDHLGHDIYMHDIQILHHLDATADRSIVVQTTVDPAPILTSLLF